MVTVRAKQQWVLLGCGHAVQALVRDLAGELPPFGQVTPNPVPQRHNHLARTGNAGLPAQPMRRALAMLSAPDTSSETSAWPNYPAVAFLGHLRRG